MTIFQLDAARLERDMAYVAIKNKNYTSAINSFNKSLDRLLPLLGQPEYDALFVSTTLDFSNLCFILGHGFSELLKLLQKALSVVERLGDQRSKGLIKLHMGRLYYFADRRHQAIKAFAEGKAEIEGLGDDGIITQSSEFIGLYYHMQGLFKEAQKYFENAVENIESENEGIIINPSAAMWICYCDAYLGNFHRAIGRLDYYRRLSLENKNHSLATTLKAVLGLVLLMIKNKQKASKELLEALKEAEESKNLMALYFCRGGMAYYYLLEGQTQKSRDWLAKCMFEGAVAGLVRQYTTPFVLEMLYEFDRLGVEPIPEFTFQKEFSRLQDDPNVHLRGVALRLYAIALEGKGEDNNIIESQLMASEDCLLRSGDPIQLAKTRIEMARLKLREGNQKKARLLAQKAQVDLSIYSDIFYPNDLKFLLDSKIEFSGEDNNRKELFELFIGMIEALTPDHNIDKLLKKTVDATNRFFGAERGGVFWFSRNTSQKNPELRVGYNLSRTDVEAKEFDPNLSLVLKCYRENEPLIVRWDGKDSLCHQAKAVLCLPIEIQGEVRGVLYHDNSYIKDCFNFLEKSQLIRLTRSITVYIENIVNLRRKLEQKVSKYLGQFGQGNYTEIVAQSPEMLRILDQADRVAASDSSVLILGETGVGKELLARRIHRMSLRRSGPFVLVDPNTIPNTLIESELFGHEKGAFTGADRQKPGRLEIANHGTLFIDEVGEIPNSIQVKLLRALEDKSFVRVGGTQRLYSDFRLVVATNRDLAEEVARGRFREDLYYRINVITITIPPLRERPQDIILLARYFLERYGSKIGRPVPHLSAKDLSQLVKYSWPGNVRELQNVIERAVLMADGECLMIDLPFNAKKNTGDLFADHLSLDEVQRMYIQYVLEKTNGKISGPKGASSILGIKRTTLYNRMKKLGIHREIL